MRKTSTISSDINVLEKRITVSGQELAFMLGVGTATARRIGTNAGAKIQIGGRTLYKVSIIEKYLEGLSGE